MLFSSPHIFKNKNAPKMPTGKKIITGTGNKKFSYCAAKMRYTNTKHTIKIIIAVWPCSASSFEIPAQS